MARDYYNELNYQIMEHGEQYIAHRLGCKGDHVTFAAGGKYAYRCQQLERGGFLNWEYRELALGTITGTNIVAFRNDRMAEYIEFMSMKADEGAYFDDAWREWDARIQEWYRRNGYYVLDGSRFNPWRALDGYGFKRVHQAGHYPDKTVRILQPYDVLMEATRAKEMKRKWREPERPEWQTRAEKAKRRAAKDYDWYLKNM